MTAIQLPCYVEQADETEALFAAIKAQEIFTSTQHQLVRS